MTRLLSARRLSGGGLMVACLLLGVLYAVMRGQDTNWDLKNYHLYNAWAVLHGRLALDLAPAGMQSYFNPLLDLPYYLLGTGPLQHLPRVLAGVQGLWYGGLIFVLLQIAIRLAKVRGRSFGVIDLLAVLIGATGTMTMSQAGSSFNEVPLAVLILLAVYQLLPLCGSAPVPRPVRRVLLAGFLCGVAAGLKPTAVVYPPALGLALLLALGARATAWRLTLLLVTAALIGFLLVYGWWGWQLYSLTGNPVFPLFNQLFHSSWVPTASGRDLQFMPRNLSQWLFYPFYWIKKNEHVVTEVTFADGRYALEMVAVIALAVLAWRKPRQPQADTRATRLLAIFVAVGYVLWLGMFSILRYAVSLEVLSGLLPMMALQASLASRQSDGRPRQWPTWLMATLFLLLAGSSRYPDWGDGPYTEVAFDIRAPAIDPGSLVLVIGQPQAYVIPFLSRARDSRYIGLTWFDLSAHGYRLGTLVHERTNTHRGAMYALVRVNADDDLKLLQHFLPGAQMTDCQPVHSNLDSDVLRLCRVERG